MPVEVIVVPNPEIAGLAAEDFEVIGEKVSHRLAQRPGSYVVLKYVRSVIKRRDTQTLSYPPAPALARRRHQGEPPLADALDAADGGIA